MATGINVPFNAGRSGGVDKISGSKQKGKILLLALAAGGDDNPFQNLGLSERDIFQKEDAQAAAGFRLEIERIFKKFKGSMALKPNSDIKIFKDPEKGLGASFEWVDLETNELNDFTEFFNQP